MCGRDEWAMLDFSLRASIDPELSRTEKESEKIESKESGGQRFSFVSRDEMEF